MLDNKDHYRNTLGELLETNICAFSWKSMQIDTNRKLMIVAYVFSCSTSPKSRI